MKLKAGTKAPDFSLQDQSGKSHSLSGYRGKWVLLYFYPRDHTPGCTREDCEFRDAFARFKTRKAIVLGVSADSVKSHDKFAAEFRLPFPILADVEKDVLKAYGTWAKKKFMGREYMGILRMSFLIDPKGKIAKIYGKVKPDVHAEEVLQDLDEGLLLKRGV